MSSYFIGVDVGTTSVRAALVDRYGAIKYSAEETISIKNTKSTFYEQSSEEIWEKCCRLVKVRYTRLQFHLLPAFRYFILHLCVSQSLPFAIYCCR